MDNITQRVENLRRLMQRENIQAYYVSGTDPHMSEYLPEHWKTRQFLSGFTGSYGEILVTMEHAILWTDTRYFLQAEEQLEGTCFEMHKLRVPEALPYNQWIVKNLNEGDRIGVTGLAMPVQACNALKKELDKANMELVFVPDLLDEIWEERPALPDSPVFELEEKYTGMPRKQKLEAIAEGIKEAGANLQVITLLDDLAWAFNLRGSDITYNPVFMGYGVIGKGRKALFVDENKLSTGLRERLLDEGVVVEGYQGIFGYLDSLGNEKILFDASTTNNAISEAIPESCELVSGTSIPSWMKALKNPVELSGFRAAMVKDGVALVYFLYWIKNYLGKEYITEYSVGRKLAEFRSQQTGFKGESFAPIVGYKEHGAIVHLSVNEENALPVKPEGILLFDSGGQYHEGTTDITRTIALGEIAQQQKTDFTLVLKGMVALTLAKFPKGTKGCHLDILARKPLWDNGLNYGHGTGHGVGHFLAVHEGPMSIRQELNEHPIVPGMVMSNEPAMYREGQYGLRTENMIVCVEKEETTFGQFYGFDTLTLCPIDKTLIDKTLLTQEEKDWINNYHIKVFKELSPLVDSELKEFLAELTSPME